MRENPEQKLLDELSDEGEALDLRKYWQLFWRHKISIFGLAMIGAIWGNLVASSLQPIYRSTTTVMIEPDSAASVVGIKDVYDPSGQRGYYETQYEILRSRAMAERLIDQLKLTEHPAFRPGKKSESNPLDFDWKGWLKEWLPETAKSINIEPDTPPPATEQAKSPAAEAAMRDSLIGLLRGSVSVEPVAGSRLVKLSYQSTDPKLAAELANALANVYVEYDMEAQLQMRTQASGWLTERIVVLRENLSRSERELQEYREKEKLVGTGKGGSATGGDFQGLNQGLNAARQRRVELEASLRQTQAARGGSVEHLISIPAVLNDETVASLKKVEAEAQRQMAGLAKRYGPKHPKMVEAQADLDEAKANVRERVLRVVEGLEREYQVAVTNEQSITGTLTQEQENLRQVERKGYKLAMLEREVESNRQLYELFLNRFKETKEVSGLDKTRARVIDSAMPNFGPIAPNKNQILMKWAGAGLALGLLLAFLLEYLDNTFKGANDLEEKLKLPVLGLLPFLKLKAKAGDTPLTYVRANRKSFFAESIRSVRTGILLSGLDDPHKVIVVTSSVPGEGKSTVAMTLADALGELHKVLLIDCDMRRPTVAKNWGMERNTSGLSDLVAKSASISECVHRIGESNVYVMPSGMVPPNPLELLSSHRFSEVLESLGKIFDHIVLDSAPSLAVSDSLVLSTYASGVVYVVKSDSTPYPVAQEGVKRLRQANAHIIGTILNSVPQGKKGRYYGKYGYYYRGKYYGDYYNSYGYTTD